MLSSNNQEQFKPIQVGSTRSAPAALTWTIGTAGTRCRLEGNHHTYLCQPYVLIEWAINGPFCVHRGEAWQCHSKVSSHEGIRTRFGVRHERLGSPMKKPLEIWSPQNTWKGTRVDQHLEGILEVCSKRKIIFHLFARSL